jgi:hypothetical protein
VSDPSCVGGAVFECAILLAAATVWLQPNPPARRRLRASPATGRVELSADDLLDGLLRRANDLALADWDARFQQWQFTRRGF